MNHPLRIELPLAPASRSPKITCRGFRRQVSPSRPALAGAHRAAPKPGLLGTGDNSRSCRAYPRSWHNRSRASPRESLRGSPRSGPPGTAPAPTALVSRRASLPVLLHYIPRSAVTILILLLMIPFWATVRSHSGPGLAHSLAGNRPGRDPVLTPIMLSHVEPAIKGSARPVILDVAFGAVMPYSGRNAKSAALVTYHDGRNRLLVTRPGSEARSNQTEEIGSSETVSAVPETSQSVLIPFKPS